MTSLLRHCLTHPRETVQHFAPKALSRLANKNKRYGQVFYPSWLSEGLPPHEDITHHNLERSREAPVLIKLVTSEFSWKPNSSWTFEAEDSEDIECLHRWGWSTPNNRFLIEDWVSFFDSQLPSINSTQVPRLEWEAYNVSERIIKFCELSREGLDLGRIRNHILRSTFYLLRNMEAFASGFGNHLFNNLRAIYMAGVVLERPDFCNYSRLKIVQVLSEIVEEGQLREGSTHYQFLIANWVQQLIPYAVKDHEFFQFLLSTGREIENTCGKLVNLGVPLFGDISPDISPIELSAAHKPVQENLSGPFWYSVVKGPHKILSRADPDGDPPSMSHAHNDALHFTYSHGEKEIFVDVGRANYQGHGISAWALTAEAHNTIFVDGKSLKPNFAHRLPPRYRRSHNLIQTIEDGLLLSSNGLRRFGLNAVTRKIQVSESALKIVDAVGQLAQVKVQFHLPHERNVKVESNQIIIDGKLILKFDPAPSEIVLLQPKDYFGKRSKTYGSQETVWYLAVSFGNVNMVITELICAE